MSKSKCGVQVISRAGESFTTKRGAARLVEANLARRIDERTIRMVEHHHRFNAPPSEFTRQSPRFTVVMIDRSIQIEKGRYRNEVLGLPNFVGIQPPRKNVGRKVA